jgi:hypothetical protein
MTAREEGTSHHQQRLHKEGPLSEGITARKKVMSPHPLREQLDKTEGSACSLCPLRGGGDDNAQGGNVTSPEEISQEGHITSPEEIAKVQEQEDRYEQEDVGAPCPCHDDTPQERENSSLVSDLCSPSYLATRLGMIPTPQREAYISSLLSNEKCSITFNKVIEPARRSLNFVVTPRTLPQTPTLHPFHHHLPCRNNGQQRNVGKDVST